MHPRLPIVVALSGLLASCGGRAHESVPSRPSAPVSGTAAASRPADPAASGAVEEPATVDVVVIAASGNRLHVKAETARTDAERERGLMFRRSMAADAGMLFTMPTDRDWSFWMKNTLIPLDMLFVDADGVVVGVVEDARPLDETSRRVGKPSRYVLEVNGGWCRKHGVGAGARIVLP